MTLILPHYGKVTRRIIGAFGTFKVYDQDLDFFNANVDLPAEEPLTDEDDSPRLRTPYKLYFPAPPLVAATLTPRNLGDRVEIQSRTYELLGRPRKLKHGRRIAGFVCAVMPVDDLYPVVANLHEDVKNPPLVEGVTFAAWGMSETGGTRSNIEEIQAEAPLEYQEDLVQNKWLVIEENRFHIQRSYVPLDGPRVRMVLRRTQ